MTPLSWGTLNGDDRLSHSNDTSGGAGASIGVGLQDIIDFSVAVEGMGGDNDILRSMGDINGDGLPDLISNGGGVQNYLNGFVRDPFKMSPDHLSPMTVGLSARKTIPRWPASTFTAASPSSTEQSASASATRSSG